MMLTTDELKKEIRRMCDEKDAIILAHYYTIGDIQDIADFVGDSLALARKAAETDAKVMVMCGVHLWQKHVSCFRPIRLCFVLILMLVVHWLIVVRLKT